MTNRIDHLIIYYGAKGAAALEAILDLYSPAALQQAADELGSSEASVDAIVQAVIAHATITAEQVASAEAAWKTAHTDLTQRNVGTTGAQWQSLMDNERAAWENFYSLRRTYRWQQKESNQ